MSIKIQASIPAGNHYAQYIIEIPISVITSESDISADRSQTQRDISAFTSSMVAAIHHAATTISPSNSDTTLNGSAMPQAPDLDSTPTKQSHMPSPRLSNTISVFLKYATTNHKITLNRDEPVAAALPGFASLHNVPLDSWTLSLQFDGRDVTGKSADELGLEDGSELQVIKRSQSSVRGFCGVGGSSTHPSWGLPFSSSNPMHR